MPNELAGVSNDELIENLRELALRERKCSHRVVLHLAEVERRRLHVELGYCSLFDYATRGLSYANASAQRRVKAAKVIVKVPEAYDALEEGHFSLSVLEVASEIADPKTLREVLKELQGATKQEALEVVARFFPVAEHSIRDRILPLAVRKETSSLFNATGAPPISEKLPSVRSEVMTANTIEPETSNGDPDEHELRSRIEFVAGSNFIEKLNRVKELMFAASGPTNLETVFSTLMDHYLRVHAPEERAKRRKERGAAGSDAAQHAEATEQEDVPVKHSSYIPLAVRDAVLERDGYQCCYVAADGTRCESRSDLQIDHITPAALGGESTLENLRVLCRAHNQLLAREAFGGSIVERITARQREKRNGSPKEEEASTPTVSSLDVARWNQRDLSDP